MWVNHVILALMGLFAGFAVSAGTFAFLIAIGVIPRLIGKSNTARAVFSPPIRISQCLLSGFW